MGLLDDAIREHLELKRLRGADPSEVVRQEREVLGASPQREGPSPEPGGAVHEALEPDAIDDVVDVRHERDDVASDALAEEDTSSAQAGSQPRPAEGPRAVAPSTDVAPVVPEQETAEVDMQAMLGVEDEAQIDDGATDVDHRHAVDPRGSGEPQVGSPPAQE